MATGRARAAPAPRRSGFSGSRMKERATPCSVQVKVPIQVKLKWRTAVDASPEMRDRVARELAGLAWELTQAEALHQDAIRVAGHERAYLMPRLELRLPLYDAGRRLRVVFSHIDTPRIHLVDEDGKRLADVLLF